MANAFGLDYYITLVFVPALVFIPLSAFAPFLLIWYILIGSRLWACGSRQVASSNDNGTIRKNAISRQF
jgi:hypothetical protein